MIENEIKPVAWLNGGHIYRSRETSRDEPLYDRAAIDRLTAERNDATARARHWKQRAKSAEGHLFASDLDAAARELHSFSRLKGEAWDSLKPQDRIGLQVAAARVIAAVNGCRDARRPAQKRDALRDAAVKARQALAWGAERLPELGAAYVALDASISAERAQEESHD